jgi:4-hydroxyphenylpyruvate dioxygenase-like putative hemolysin
LAFRHLFPEIIGLTQQQNSMGMDGLEFIELAAPDPMPPTGFLSRSGFSTVGRHRFNDVTLYRQGRINLLVSADLPSLARSFVNVRASSVRANCHSCLLVRPSAGPLTFEFVQRIDA